MKTPRRKRRGIRCHAGLDPASSLDFWIPAFAGMTIHRNRAGYEKGNTNFVPLTLPSPKERELAETPPQADGVLKT